LTIPAYAEGADWPGRPIGCPRGAIGCPRGGLFVHRSHRRL